MKIVFLGPPGSGKGTQAAKLGDEFQLQHISTGDVFRAALKSEAELGREVKSFVESGKLVPDHLVSALVFEKLKELGSDKSLILDGYPRTVGQAESLDGFMKTIDAKIDAIINIAVNNKELFKRLLDRKQKENRVDDSENVIRERLNIYEVQTAPVVDHYKNRPEYIEVNGDQPIDKVYSDIVKGLKDRKVVA